MLARLSLVAALLLAVGGARAAAGEKVSPERLAMIMSAWPADVRANAEHLVSEFGMPDRVTSTILVWDVHSAAQQHAMMQSVERFSHSGQQERWAPLSLN